MSYFWSFFAVFFGRFRPLRPQVGALLGLATLAYKPSPLVVEGFSPRLSLLFGIPVKLFSVPTGLYSRSPWPPPGRGGGDPGPAALEAGSGGHPPGPLPHTPGQRGRWAGSRGKYVFRIARSKFDPPEAQVPGGGQGEREYNPVGTGENVPGIPNSRESLGLKPSTT